MITWDVSYADTDNRCSAYEALSPEQIADYEQMAVEFLWNWTGRRYGAQEVTVRPCRAPDREPTWTDHPRSAPRAVRTSSVVPVDTGTWELTYGWTVQTSCVCRGGCACGDSSAVINLRAPVASVVRVVQDGVELLPATYRIDNYRLLVRQDGMGWPMSQNLDAPLGEMNTFGVTYVHGIPVPIGGQRAAGTLACELAKQAVGDNTCRLPIRFSAITRQGVTVAALDTFEDLDQGHTGIWSIDSWVTSVTRPRGRSTVMSPDVPRRRKQTWP